IGLDGPQIPMLTATPDPGQAGLVDLGIAGTVTDPVGGLKYLWACNSAPNDGAEKVLFTTQNTPTTAASVPDAGDYEFQLEVVDGLGNAAIRTISYSTGPGNGQTLSSISISANKSKVGLSGTLNFTAIAKDQLGHPMDPQPTIAWDVLNK